MPPFLRRRPASLQPPAVLPREEVVSGSEGEGVNLRILPADALVQLADEAWRLGQRAGRLSRASGPEIARGVLDSAERLKAVLNEMGLTFEDHTGKPYRHEERLDVAQVDGEVSESSSLWITQTVKPTVMLEGRVIRHGQVILSSNEPATEEGEP